MTLIKYNGLRSSRLQNHGQKQEQSLYALEQLWTIDQHLQEHFYQAKINSADENFNPLVVGVLATVKLAELKEIFFSDNGSDANLLIWLEKLRQSRELEMHAWQNHLKEQIEQKNKWGTAWLTARARQLYDQSMMRMGAIMLPWLGSKIAEVASPAVKQLPKAILAKTLAWGMYGASQITSRPMTSIQVKRLEQVVMDFGLQAYIAKTVGENVALFSTYYGAKLEHSIAQMSYEKEGMTALKITGGVLGAAFTYSMGIYSNLRMIALTAFSSKVHQHWRDASIHHETASFVPDYKKTLTSLLEASRNNVAEVAAVVAASRPGNFSARPQWKSKKQLMGIEQEKEKIKKQILAMKFEQSQRVTMALMNWTLYGASCLTKSTIFVLSLFQQRFSNRPQWRRGEQLSPAQRRTVYQQKLDNFWLTSLAMPNAFYTPKSQLSRQRTMLTFSIAISALEAVFGNAATFIQQIGAMAGGATLPWILTVHLKLDSNKTPTPDQIHLLQVLALFGNLVGGLVTRYGVHGYNKYRQRDLFLQQHSQQWLEMLGKNQIKNSEIQIRFASGGFLSPSFWRDSHEAVAVDVKGFHQNGTRYELHCDGVLNPQEYSIQCDPIVVSNVLKFG